MGSMVAQIHAGVLASPTTVRGGLVDPPSVFYPVGSGGAASAYEQKAKPGPEKAISASSGSQAAPSSSKAGENYQERFSKVGGPPQGTGPAQKPRFVVVKSTKNPEKSCVASPHVRGGIVAIKADGDCCYHLAGVIGELCLDVLFLMG